MQQKRFIDFFGGVHGNYLELVVNHWIDQNYGYDITLPQFSTTGACHQKNKSASYKPVTRAHHWSQQGVKFRPEHLVIRIVPTHEDLLIAVTNSFLRAGDQALDLEQLEQDTYSKMNALPKLGLFLNTLVENHGKSESYGRKTLRKYFYAMFDENQHGLDLLTNFVHAEQVYNFQFRSFFSFSRFYEELQHVAKFVNMKFLYTPYLHQLHNSFLEKNQGWISENKCYNMIEDIVQQRSNSYKLNIIEEAWITYRISRIFNLYDIPELEDNIYPTDTKYISDICYARNSCA